MSAESVYDSDNLLVTTSAGTGVKIDKNCGSSVEVGTDVDFEIYVTDEDKYELDRITPVSYTHLLQCRRTQPDGRKVRGQGH